MCIRTEILTVEGLRRNVLSKKMCFHFYDYPIYTYIYIYIYTQEDDQNRHDQIFQIYQILMYQI